MNKIVKDKLIIMLSDGFVWLDVSEKAKEIYSSGTFELYQLYDDGGEGLIESREDLNNALANGLTIAVEVGNLSTDNMIEVLEANGYVRKLWQVDDIKQQAESDGVANQLTDEDYEDIRKCLANVDCNVGISWEVISIYISNHIKDKQNV